MVTAGPPAWRTIRRRTRFELYVRGLDNYVWAEGYIIRGPNAGTLVTACVPYLPNRTSNLVQKVLQGLIPSDAGCPRAGIARNRRG